MTKISLIDRPGSLRPSTPLRPALVDPRQVLSDPLERAQLYLVPRTTREVVAPSRYQRCRRVLRQHPFLVDAGFVAMTLGMATLLWWCGW